MALDTNYLLNQACNFAYDRQSHYLVFIFLSFAIFPFVKATNTWNQKKSFLVMASAVILLHLDSILLGEIGPREWGDDGRAWVGFMPFLAKNKDLFQQPYLWNLFSGTPLLGSCPFAGNLLCLRSILFEYMEPHNALLAIRLLVSSAACFGMFLVSKKCGAYNQMAAFIAVSFLAAYDFNSTLTLQYGLDLAGLPLLLCCLTKQKLKISVFQYLGITFFICLSTLFYTLTKIFILLLFCKLYFYLSFKFSATKVLTFLTFWIFNNIFSILGFMELLKDGAREELIRSLPLIGGLHSLFDWLNQPFFTFNRGGFFLFFILNSLFLMSILQRQRKSFSILTFAMLTWFSSVFLSSVPWEVIGFSFLKSYRWYLEYTVFIMSGAMGAFIASHIQNNLLLSRIMLTILAATSITYFLVSKAGRIENASFYGNLSHQFSVRNLRSELPEIFKEQKVLALPYLFDANSLPNYGIYGFNGWTSIPSKKLLQFWDQYVIFQKNGLMYESNFLKYPVEITDLSKNIEIETYLSLDALRALGVGIILSQHPLKSSKNLEQSACNTFQESSLTDKVFKLSKNILVYKITNPLPLVYSCEKTIWADPKIRPEYLVTKALKGILITKHELQNNQLSSSIADRSVKKCFYQNKKNKLVIQTSESDNFVVINFAFSKSLQAFTVPDNKPVPIEESAFGQIYLKNNYETKTIEIF